MKEKDINEKYLEFIENNISRMNQCSFKIKGWAITVVSGFLAVFASTINQAGESIAYNKAFIYIALAPTILFWFLDSLYFSKEKKMRGLYDDASKTSKSYNQRIIKDYDMSLKPYSGWNYSIVKAAISPSLCVLYVSICLGLIIFAIFSK